MVNHFVFWNFKKEMAQDEKKEAAIRIKNDLIALKNRIDGLLEIDVCFDSFETSNREIALFTSFASVESLNEYQKHPEHISASAFLKSVTCDRICFDYKS